MIILFGHFYIFILISSNLFSLAKNEIQCPRNVIDDSEADRREIKPIKGNSEKVEDNFILSFVW